MLRKGPIPRPGYRQPYGPKLGRLHLRLYSTDLQADFEQLRQKVQVLQQITESQSHTIRTLRQQVQTLQQNYRMNKCKPYSKLQSHTIRTLHSKLLLSL